ncbi:efflux RND transporter permease subunit, partial [Vibrio parahaemolyticus]
AMRIWPNPSKLQSYGLNAGDVVTAVTAPNTEVAAGEIGGQPVPETQMLNATVTAQSRLSTPEQFRNIVVKTATDGSVVRLADVARVELG